MSKPGGSQSEAGQLHKEKLEEYVVHWAGLQKGQSMHCREIVSHFGISGCGASGTARYRIWSEHGETGARLQ
jgi:hypothetical protein